MTFKRFAPNSKWGSSVTVDMKSVQLVALFGFLFTVVDFVAAPFEDKPPPTTPPASPPSSRSAPTPPPLPAEITKATTQTKIQVQIDSPQILIPGPDDSSPDRLVVALGDFSMHNSFSPSSKSPTGTTESFVCALSKMHMRSVRGGAETDILHDVHLDVVIISEKPVLQINVGVQTLAFEISDVEWQFLYATIWKTIDSFDDVGTKSSPMSPQAVGKFVGSPSLTSKKSTKGKKDKDKDKDDIHVNVKIVSAALIATTKGEKLAQFSIHDIIVDVDMEQKTDSLRVDGSIGNVILLDVRTSAAPLYKTILSSKDNTREMVLFTYESLGTKPHVPSSDPNEMVDWHSAFTMQFRQVEMVAMVGFILTVKDLVLLPIFARLDLEAARAKAERIKTSSPAKLSKLKLKVEIESPVVLLPSSPTQKDMIIAELGHFSLANHYVIKEGEEYSHVVTGYPNSFILCEIRNMNMKSTRGGTTEQALKDVQISLAIDFPSSPTLHQKIIVGIPKLEFSLSDQGWHFLYRIILVLIANMATPNAPSEPTFVDVKIGVVSLVLTQEMEARKQLPFASASINDISVGVSMKSNSFMKVDGSVGSLRLIDDRTTPDDHLYRDVLIPQDKNVNTIDFSYHEVYQNSVADTAINILLSFFGNMRNSI